MTVVFFGSSAFSVPTLKSMHPSVVTVVTRKTKPKGRGRLLEDNEVKREALALGLPVVEIDSFKDEAAQRLAHLGADLFVVASFGLIIPRRFLELPTIGCLNVHPSLLPRYRGPAPMQWAIWNGDRITGITIIAMNEKMDEGDILYQEETPISPDEDAHALSERLSLRAAEILPKVAGEAEGKGTLHGLPQDEEKATYTPMITKEMGKIAWSADASRIVLQVRALVDWPTAYTLLEEKMVKVFKARTGARDLPAGRVPGSVLAVSGDGIEVAAGKGSVVLEEVQAENKRRMAASDFARGYRQLGEKQFR
jgi:methionyl-tRNA formyltransferase